MWETLSESERIWITMNENSSQVTIHFKVAKSAVDENYWLDLPYAEWRNFIAVARRARRYSEGMVGNDIIEGSISCQWLAQDCIQLCVGTYFGRYFNSDTW